RNRGDRLADDRHDVAGLLRDLEALEAIESRVRVVEPAQVAGGRRRGDGQGREQGNDPEPHRQSPPQRSVVRAPELARAVERLVDRHVCEAGHTVCEVVGEGGHERAAFHRRPPQYGASPISVTRSMRRYSGSASASTRCCVQRLSHIASESFRQRKRQVKSGADRCSVRKPSSARLSAGFMPTIPFVNTEFTNSAFRPVTGCVRTTGCTAFWRLSRSFFWASLRAIARKPPPSWNAARPESSRCIASESASDGAYI